MCVCVCFTSLTGQVIFSQECLTLPFLPSVGSEPASGPVIAVNMEMQYSHQDCSAHLMDNFCHLSRTPFLSSRPPLFIFVLSFNALITPMYPTAKSSPAPKFKDANVYISETPSQHLHRGKSVEFIEEVAIAIVCTSPQWRRWCECFLISWPYFQKTLLTQNVSCHSWVLPHRSFIFHFSKVG